ncbi:MAG: Gfo/Idh/MocA family oxidoreductase [Crocinitomicaceae bacterium]|nr:Gfo/Idh/MocA family oxidoreductase [Crocinitomicaceae bacterium]
MKIRFAIVGCGSIGKRHLAVIDAESMAEVVAICDIEENRVRELSELYNGVPWFTDYNTMLSEINADVVNVVTPHFFHKQHSIQALHKGFHVLVEKPMALSVKDCREMIAAAATAKKKLWVVKQNRHNVPVRLAQEAIREGRLGKIFMIKCDILWNRYQGYYDESDWRGKIEKEGGALFTQASHFIDLLVWWCGDITGVKAITETQNHNIETEDSGVAILHFSSGTIGSLVWTTCVYHKNFEGSITVIGERGTIKIGGQYLNKMEFWDVEGFELPQGIDFNDKPNSYGKYQGTSSNHDKVIKAVVGVLNDQSAEVVEGLEGLRSIDAIEKIYSNIRQ